MFFVIPNAVRDLLLLVIPAKAGIHFDFRDVATEPKARWIPAFAGMTSKVKSVSP
jgi:hypothetical protein